MSGFPGIHVRYFIYQCQVVHVSLPCFPTCVPGKLYSLPHWPHRSGPPAPEQRLPHSHWTPGIHMYTCIPVHKSHWIIGIQMYTSIQVHQSHWTPGLQMYKCTAVYKYTAPLYTVHNDLLLQLSQLPLPPRPLLLSFHDHPDRQGTLNSSYVLYTVLMYSTVHTYCEQN